MLCALAHGKLTTPLVSFVVEWRLASIFVRYGKLESRLHSGRETKCNMEADQVESPKSGPAMV